MKEPHIITNEIGRDFGFGFYTSDIKEQAIRWARRKALIETRRGFENIHPIVNVYEWDEEATQTNMNICLKNALESLQFINYFEE